MDVLTYNGKAFSEFNTYFDGSKAFGSPGKDYEFYEILGRNGSLSRYNHRFNDISLEFPCFIRTDFIRNFRNLLSYLNGVEGYQRLESSKEPNVFRKAVFEGAVEPTTTPFNHGGFFTITFRCRPQRWLKSGEIWVNAGTQIFNPTNQTARPIIRIYGTGSFMIGSDTVTVNTAGTAYIDLDCETMDAYEGAVNRNDCIETGFEQIGLKPGNNGITTDGVTLKIMPRWFEI